MQVPQVITHASDHWSDRAGLPIRAIVLHHTAGTNSLSYLTHNDRQASTHALITKAGVIYAMVPDSRAANAVGFSNLGRFTTAAGDAGNANQITYSIELENLGNGHDDYPDAQIDACGWDIARVWRTHGRVPILTHALIDTQGKLDPLGLDLVRVYRAAVAWYDGQLPTTPAPAGGYSGASPLLGEPKATRAQCVAYLNATPTGEYSENEVRLFVDTYFAQAVPLVLDPVIAIAQLCKETGWNGAHGLASFWSQRPQRNPAGIGVTGEHKPATEPDPGPGWELNTQRNQWELGISFPTWVEHAIPAHIGRLLAYALTDAQASLLQLEAIEEALAVRPLPVDKRGCAPVLDGLGGTWAKDIGYGGRIAAIANAIRSMPI